MICACFFSVTTGLIRNMVPCTRSNLRQSSRLPDSGLILDRVLSQLSSVSFPTLRPPLLFRHLPIRISPSFPQPELRVHPSLSPWSRYLKKGEQLPPRRKRVRNSRECMPEMSMKVGRKEAASSRKFGLNSSVSQSLSSLFCATSLRKLGTAPSHEEGLFAAAPMKSRIFFDFFLNYH